MECEADNEDESIDASTASGTADSTPGEQSKEVEDVPAGETEEAGETKKARDTKEGEDEGTEKVYQCPVCQKPFEKYQALGGHMNAHPEAKMKRRFDEYTRMQQKYACALNPQQSSWSQALGNISRFVPGPVNATPNSQRSIWSQAPPNSFNFAPGLANDMLNPQQPSGSEAPRNNSYFVSGWSPNELSSVPDPANFIPLQPPALLPSAGEANSVAAPPHQFPNPQFGPSTPPLCSEPYPGFINCKLCELFPEEAWQNLDWGPPDCMPLSPPTVVPSEEEPNCVAAPPNQFSLPQCGPSTPPSTPEPYPCYNNNSSPCSKPCCNPISQEAWRNLDWGQPNFMAPPDAEYFSEDPDAEILWEDPSPP